MGETCIDAELLHLRWHAHSGTFTDMLQELYQGKAYTDVSLVCDGGVVRAHRAVLSLCSPYLANVLVACAENDDAPLLLPEVPVQDVKYLISFIYKGQVDVPQQNISSFLDTGKHLQVLGLEQGARLVDSPCKSEESGSSNSSEVGEDAVSSPTPTSDDLSRNNNNSEKEDDENENPETTNLLCQPNVIKMEHHPIKEEVLYKDEVGENEVAPDGKIDLNFYLQQAIQSASMPCPLCKKEFKSQSGLRDHIRLHTGERPFICEFCHMNFARQSHLKRHRRMHTGEKPFECRICGKDFSRGDKLKDHLRRHEAEEKLNKIRNQFLQIEEGSGESNNKPQVPNSASGSVIYPMNSMTNSYKSMISMPLSNSPTQVLNRKSINTPPSQDQNLMPPLKRKRGRPPKNNELPMPASFQQPGVMTVPSMLTQQNDIPINNMLGVASIGECILRPIN